MNIRKFDGTEKDTKELILMFIDLKNYDNEEKLSYAENIGSLYSILYRDGCNCFMIEKDKLIVGFIIIYPDGKGGAIIHSLYLKDEVRKTLLFSKVINWIEEFIKANFSYCLFNALNIETGKLYSKRYKKHSEVYKFIPKEN